MKYIILSKGCPFGDYDTVWGYVNSKDSAMILCEHENYYFIEADESSNLYSVNLCLEHLVETERRLKQDF